MDFFKKQRNKIANNKINQPSNAYSGASGTINTTTTLLDDTSISGCSTLTNGSSITAPSPSNSSTNISPISNGVELGEYLIFNYVLGDFEKYKHLNSTTCEDICLQLCRKLKILPITRLLFGLRAYDTEDEWAVPGKPIKNEVRYVFRMRFKVPYSEIQLQSLDPNAFEYLYRQMRYDMVRECIPEIRYPAEKDKVMGLGVVDMYIDLLEQRDSVERIAANYERYVPRKLVKAHKVFVKPRICNGFHQFRRKNVNLATAKWTYVREILNLATNYLLEMYIAVVDYIPNDIAAISEITNGSVNMAEAHVYVKLDLYDTPEPGLKIARKAPENNLKWTLITNLENIFAVSTEDTQTLRLEITEFPNGYRMRFKNQIGLESFITYLAGYVRLTSKWMLDLCGQYPTPSLQELLELRCHGPIGGNFSFAKIREKRDKCGSYIIRQCEKEYDIYYIDINTKASGLQSVKCKTETFKIIKENNSQWILHYNERLVSFNKLVHLAQHIETETNEIFRIPPSKYDKPPLLLICLPKELQSKKTETELSEAELQRKRVQIFDPKVDLQWYKNSMRECDQGRMVRYRADWIQQGRFKEVPVILKVLKYDTDFLQFRELANTWSKIYSPHFLKLYGLTLSTPYTLIMENAEYGPLNEFLIQFSKKVSLRPLLDVVGGLVRGIVYLQEFGFIHGYIRCSNLYVTKFNPKSNLLEVKLADSGLSCAYTKADLPWIPFEYYSDLDAAKHNATTDLWAFATTLWEIFARGKQLVNLTAEDLRKNYNRYGGILPIPNEDCPEDIYKTMMDGWCQESDKRFNHHEIFARLIFMKQNLNYESADCDNSADFESEWNRLHEDTYSDSSLQNGHSESYMEMSTISNNSTVCDRAPLVRHQQASAMQQQQQRVKPSYRSYFDDTASVVRVPQGKLIYKKKIGEGHYGTVYLGELQYNSANERREQVAIKTLKILGAKQLYEDFKREIKIMQALDHPNIVKIKMWVQDPISIIMEYFESGSFIVYLSSRKPDLTNERLLNFALDIAKGMDYLRNQNIIHRDLAARNVLVDRDCVKISDFGLAQWVNSEGYYIMKSFRDIPIMWYSPESLNTNKFSFQSDVWSYGVTLYEMFSRGEVPNLDPDMELRKEEIISRLEKGDRLRKPVQCPDIVYNKLMMPCWHANPKARPTFKMIIEEIQSIKSESGEYL